MYDQLITFNFHTNINAFDFCYTNTYKILKTLIKFASQNYIYMELNNNSLFAV